jgi:hypothetical protein
MMTTCLIFPEPLDASGEAMFPCPAKGTGDGEFAEHALNEIAPASAPHNAKREYFMSPLYSYEIRTMEQRTRAGLGGPGPGCKRMRSVKTTQR